MKLEIVAISALFALAAAPALARTAACCRAPAGTLVQVELAEPVGTLSYKTGATFALRLAAPLIVNGRIVLRAGTPGVGDIVESSKAGMGGKPAKLVLAARYLQKGGVHVPLEGLQLAAGGRNNGTAASAVGLTGLIFGPLGFVGLAVSGGDVTFPAGTKATAKLAADVALPSLGLATRAQIAAAAATARAAAEAPAGAIAIPPPPSGQGQVVFFRRKSVLGTAQWFKVREGGQALGKLTNGAYFVQVTTPGTHTYTSVYEPEFKDHLTLQIDAGETYFVEGAITKALIVGQADLSPSSRAAFDKASKDLKPAPPLTDDSAASANNTADSGEVGGAPPRQ